METVEVVIRIPKEMHKALVQGSFGAKYNMYDLVGCVMNGTPLPKGHGRLIDADKLIKAIEKKSKRLKNLDTINGLCGAVALIYDAEVIIEVDKEVEDG